MIVKYLNLFRSISKEKALVHTLYIAALHFSIKLAPYCHYTVELVQINYNSFYSEISYFSSHDRQISLNLIQPINQH